MADEVDLAQAREEAHRTKALASRPAFYMPKGKPGECEYCEKFSPRLVRGVCARCRDEHGLS